MPDRPTLLVADDTPENLMLFSVYLRRDYRVETAETAEEAFARLEAGGVDAALLDINYQGGMTGHDLIRVLRADERFVDLPTLALTAHASPEDRAQCLSEGFDAYLSKPVLKAEMLAAVAALLEERESGGDEV